LVITYCAKRVFPAALKPVIQEWMDGDVFKAMQEVMARRFLSRVGGSLRRGVRLSFLHHGESLASAFF